MNLCEALESGKRYNRALHNLSDTDESSYLYVQYDTEKLVDQDGNEFPITVDALSDPQWDLSSKAPYFGPAGMLTLERARGMAAQAWCTPENEQKVMDCDLCEAFAQIMMKIGNGTVAFIDPKEEVANGEEQSSVSERS